MLVFSSNRSIPGLISATIIASILGPAQGKDLLLEPNLRHLRIDGPREWIEFDVHSESGRLLHRFEAHKNETESTLRLRQQDVKQQWSIFLGETRIGTLHRDENDMVVYFPVPANTLTDGSNELRVEQMTGGQPIPDDIRVGEITLFDRPVHDVLMSSKLEVEVVDADSQVHSPARITILDDNGSLQMVGAESRGSLAVRPGTVYTSNGRATFGLPPGRYTIFAGRGFEFTLASTSIEIAHDDELQVRLAIRREVPTKGYVACDTHVHSLTHSGHGDATDRERVITVAAEGIELPIFTDHNLAIDYEPVARTMNVRQYFTPVVGNEVTTSVGHFNIFPIALGSRMPDASLKDWQAIFDQIYATPGVRVAILNHARDLHGGTRPFGPRLHLDVVGENFEGWQLQANGMEVINSAATQSDVLQLFHDWMGLLNAGLDVTPVGSSDSHDVARHFVGQGRTYIRCDDSNPESIDVDEAVENFLSGRVLVSYGLAVELTVEDQYRSGDVASVSGEELRLMLRVLGPGWTSASRVLLYSNGTLIRDVEIPDRKADPLPSGVKWQREWVLPRPAHDVHLVAIALGPGIDPPYWKTAKPYQPTSPEWHPHVAGCSGAVWIDADGDGEKSSPRRYAERLIAESGSDLPGLLARLAGYDEAVAAQAAHLYRIRGGNLRDPSADKALGQASRAVMSGFRRYLDAWRKSELAAVTP